MALSEDAKRIAIAALEKEIATLQEAITELRGGVLLPNIDTIRRGRKSGEAVTISRRRRGRPKGSSVATGPTRRSKVPAPKVRLGLGKRPDRKSYFVSQKHLLAILEDAGEPLTTFKIKQALEAKLNIVPSDNALDAILKAAKAGGKIVCPQQGEWAIKND